MASRADNRVYDHYHRKMRTALLPDAYGTACPLCGEVMLESQPLDLDHTIPVVHGGGRGPVRITHATCNRSQGARLRRPTVKATSRPSREW